MISQIRGKLIEVEDDKVVVDVGGVGYEIEVASSVLDTSVSYTHLTLPTKRIV